MKILLKMFIHKPKQVKTETLKHAFEISEHGVAALFW